jgi:hypothetical protein
VEARSSTAPNPGRIAAFAAIAAAALLLLWAAIYNGYPLTFWDTRAYLEHARTLLPRPDRLIGYSLFIRAISLGITLWPVVIAQCALVAWLVWRAMRVLLGRVAIGAYLGLMLVLAAATALPWVAGQLLADVFTAVLVLALFMLLEARDLRRLERGVLLALVALCVSVHLTHLPIGLGLLALAFVAYLRSGERALSRVRAPALALLAGVVGIAGFNYARTGRMQLASGSDAFVLAHLVESGIASRVLSEHCPERDYMLCPYRAQLPMSTDRFLWVDALDIYPWQQQEAISKETKRLLKDSLIEHPFLHVQVATSYTLAVLGRFATGEGLDSDARDLVEPQIAASASRDLAAYRAAKQQHDALPVAALKRVHTPFGWLMIALATALCLAALVPRFARLRGDPGVRFAAFALAAYVLNGALSGNLSGIYDRYESRIVWLLLLGPWAFWLRRRTPSAER